MNEIQINGLPKIVFVGTFPPTDEGIATFNEDLVEATQKFLGREVLCRVVAINLRDTSPFYFDEKVSWEIDQDTLGTYINAVNDINNDKDVKCVILQHEYGLFGGNWGKYIAEFMEKLKKPTITIMHSVLEKGPFNPKEFREVTNKIVENSSALVVLSKKSKETLTQLYPSMKDLIYFIPHGIHPLKFVIPKIIKSELQLSQRIVLTTFGLLSQDKGIEYVLKALPKVIKKYPNVLYQILGQTHPIIRRREGEKYRKSLVALTKRLGIRKNVRFVDKYMSVPEELKYLQGTDLYIATSINPNQAVSGTFSYAVGAGRAVVSTEFVQSKEVLTKKMGRLVPAKNSKAYTDAILELLADRKLLNVYHRTAFSKTRTMLWTNVAKNYIRIIKDLIGIEHKNFSLPNVDLTHLKKMTTRHGLIQFAKYDVPAKESGYTLDDNARALVVTNWLIQNDQQNDLAKKLQNVYFSFIKRVQKLNGEIVNYLDINLHETRQNKEEVLEEHLGRLLWALSETISNKKATQLMHNQSISLWKLHLDKVSDFKFLRPKAYAIKAICKVYKNSEFNKEKHLELINKLSQDLLEAFYENNEKYWHWFETYMSYNNALLPQSLALAYQVTRKKEYIKIAKKSFSFFLKKTFMGEVYVPIGQNDWYKKGKKRSYYDQQPEDPAATVMGLITMFEITKKAKYLNLASHAFTWFLGNNLNGIPMYNFKTGGVYDGLKEDGVNKNQGAESLVSYLLARIKIEKYY